MRTMLVALLLTVASVTSTPVSVHYKIRKVDPVERQFWGVGQAKPVLGVFSTTYRINHKKVGPMTFWRALRAGDELDAKITPHRIFSVAVAADVDLTRR